MRDALALGQRIRERRVERGLSQKQLAGEELSPSYVSLLEAGKRWPTLDALELIAAKLSTTSAALLDEHPEGTRSHTERDLDLKWAKIALRAGNPESAEKYARVVLDDSSISESERLDALSLVAAATESQGRITEAIDILEALIEELDADHTRQLWLSCQIMLLRCYKEAGDTDHAVDLGERAIGRIGSLVQEDEMMLAISLAHAYSERGDLRRSSNLLKMVSRRAENAGSYRARGGALWNASVVAGEEGRLDDAVRLAEQAVAIFGESDAVRNMGNLRTQYAYVLIEQGDDQVSAARDQLVLARTDLDLEGTEVDRAQNAVDMARCDLIDGDIEAAESHIIEAHMTIQGGQHYDVAAQADLVRSHVLVAQGEVDEGLALARAAAEQLEQYSSPRDAARSWRAVADLAREHDAPELRMDALERAVEVTGVRPTRVASARRQSVVSRVLG